MRWVNLQKKEYRERERERKKERERERVGESAQCLLSFANCCDYVVDSADESAGIQR